MLNRIFSSWPMLSYDFSYRFTYKNIKSAAQKYLKKLQKLSKIDNSNQKCFKGIVKFANLKTSISLIQNRIIFEI